MNYFMMGFWFVLGGCLAIGLLATVASLLLDIATRKILYRPTKKEGEE